MKILFTFKMSITILCIVLEIIPACIITAAVQESCSAVLGL